MKTSLVAHKGVITDLLLAKDGVTLYSHGRDRSLKKIDLKVTLSSDGATSTYSRNEVGSKLGIDSKKIAIDEKRKVYYVSPEKFLIEVILDEL